MGNCISDIRLRMLNDNLKLNDDKTEFLIIGTPLQLVKVDITSIRVGNSDIHPVPIASGIISYKRQLRHSFKHSYPVVLTTATAYCMACLIPH